MSERPPERPPPEEPVEAVVLVPPEAELDDSEEPVEYFVEEELDD
jgi:hypothetical protein